MIVFSNKNYCFETDDIVRIKTMEECEKEGHHCVPNCALNQYENSICKVISTRNMSCKIVPVELCDKNLGNLSIDKYKWNNWALQYVGNHNMKEIKEIAEEEIEILFEKDSL